VGEVEKINKDLLAEVAGLREKLSRLDTKPGSLL
jgi:hypothetical protein